MKIKEFGKIYFCPAFGRALLKLKYLRKYIKNGKTNFSSWLPEVYSKYLYLWQNMEFWVFLPLNCSSKTHLFPKIGQKFIFRNCLENFSQKVQIYVSYYIVKIIYYPFLRGFTFYKYIQKLFFFVKLSIFCGFQCIIPSCSAPNLELYPKSKKIALICKFP